MKIPDGYEEIVAVFGDPLPYVEDHVGWERRILELFDLPFPLPYLGGTMVSRVRAHRLVGPLLVDVLEDLAERGGRSLIASFDGLYAFRAKRRDPSKFSVHTFGAAIDLNAGSNRQGQPPTQPSVLVEVFRDHGWTWGGDFSGGSIDGMHFQLARGY